MLDVGMRFGRDRRSRSRSKRSARSYATDISTRGAGRGRAERPPARRAGRVRLLRPMPRALRDRTIDVMVSNPPYVPGDRSAGFQREVRDYEPHVALFAGPTGFEIYERLVADARRVLAPGRLAGHGTRLQFGRAGARNAPSRMERDRSRTRSGRIAPRAGGPASAMTHRRFAFSISRSASGAMSKLDRLRERYTTKPITRTAATISHSRMRLT